MMEKVFVYGTLKEGYGLNYAMKNGRKIANAKAQGELRQSVVPYFLPVGVKPFPQRISRPVEKSDYTPAVRWYSRPDTPLVKGELWEVPELDMIEVLDRIEGYYPTHPTESHYIRVRTLVMPEGEETPTECWVYIFNATDGMSRWNRLKPSPGGEYEPYYSLHVEVE